MIYKIELLPTARKELIEPWDWYDDRWTGLGDRFMREAEKRLQDISLLAAYFIQRFAKAGRRIKREYSS